jgi:hypothetical protein
MRGRRGYVRHVEYDGIDDLWEGQLLRGFGIDCASSTIVYLWRVDTLALDA